MENSEEKKEFISEKIKAKPKKGNKIIHKSITTLVLAFVFGLVACLTFLALQPIISNIIYPKDIVGKVIELPEDDEEMLPEQMVGDWEEPQQIIRLEMDKAQMNYIVENITLDKSDYQRMYESMANYVGYLEQYMVEVISIQSDTDWFMNVSEKKKSTSGTIIAKTEESYFILTDYSTISNSEKTTVTFFNDEKVSAEILNYHSDSDLAILQVNKSDLSEKSLRREFSVASLGASYNDKLRGTVAIAMGSPLGYYDSIGYGIITSNNTKCDYQDLEYQLITTNIVGSSAATGTLFDLNGRVLGMIVTGKNSADMKNTITVYGISDLKKMINFLLTGEKMPYVGIYGETITEEIVEEYQIPYGMYVREVSYNSPARLAGFQKGDIIIALDNNKIQEVSDYSTYLMKKKEGETVTFRIMRQMMNQFREIEVEVEIGQRN